MAKSVYDDRDTDLDELEKAFHAPSATQSGSDQLPGTTDMSEFEDDLDDSSGSGTSGSDARAAKNRRTAAGRGARRQTTSRDVSADSLAEQENDVPTSLYTGSGGTKKNENPGKGLSARLSKKKVGIAGGITGLGVGAGMLGLTYTIGPAEFLHLAANTHIPHWGAQEDASDGRMGKLYRWLRKDGSIGQTRLSWIGSKYHARITGKLKAIGITPQYGALDTYKGLTIDTENEKSPYKGMSTDEATKAVEEKYGIKPKVEGGKLTINAETYWSQHKTLKVGLNELGNSKMSAVRIRYFKKFGWVTWRPLEIADKKLNAKLAKFYNEKWKKIMTTGEEGPPVAIDAKDAKGDEVDKDGNRLPASESEQKIATVTPTEPTASSSTLKGLATSKGASIAGGVAAVAGVVCALKAVNDNVGAIRYTQVIVPMIRMSMDALTIAEQIKSGQGVDMAELQYLSKNLSSVNKTNGEVQTWYDTRSIRSNSGDSTGRDTLKDNGTKDLITQSSVPWLEWTSQGPFPALCSTVGTVTATAISIGLGVLSGGILSTATGVIIGGVLTGPIIDKASALLAGKAVNPLVGANPAPVYGASVDMGSVLAANAASVGMGGVALTPAQSATLTGEVQQENQEEFAARPFFARMFDVDDYRSLTGRMADNLGLGSNVLTNTNNMFSSILGSVSSVWSLPFKLYSSTVHAAVTPYDYGVSIIGMSKQDLNNPIVQDPYENAETVAKILNSNNQNGVADYIQKAKDCFGVTITNGAEGWDVIPTNDVNIYDKKNYNTADCKGAEINNQGKVTTASKFSVQNPSQPIMAQTASTPLTAAQSLDWLRIRFFIMDTGVMEGYACAEFTDNTSCINDGMTAAAASADTNDPKTIANNILGNTGVKLSANARSDLSAVANGQTIPSPCSGEKPVTLDTTLLTAIDTLGGQYDFTIDNFVTGHACDKGRSPLGRGMEITELDSKPINWTGTSLKDDQDFAADVASVLTSLMPDGKIQNGQPINMPGLGVCHQSDISPPPSGINYYTGKCDRLGADTGVPIVAS